MPASSDRINEARAADLGPPRSLVYLAAALSLAAALLHLWVTPEHFEEWWGYGAFFMVAALAQGIGGAALLRWPVEPLFVVGIFGNLAIVVLWLTTRTAGVPFFGPHAWEVESVGAVDLGCTLAELALLATLAALLRTVRQIGATA
jgi:hypothetical protein